MTRTITRVIISLGGEGTVTVREILRLLRKDGWVFKNQEGSHMHYIHPAKKEKVTVPNHKGDLKIKTANSILKHAGLK